MEGEKDINDWIDSELGQVTVCLIVVGKGDKEVLMKGYFKKLRNIARYLKSLTRFKKMLALEF